MSNSKIVFSENGLSVGVDGFHNWVEHTYQRLKQAAKKDDEYLALYKVVKKRKKRDTLKRKVTPRSVYVVTHVTENSFTITPAKKHSKNNKR